MPFGMRDHKCPDCKKKFYECENCGATFNTKPELANHIKNCVDKV